MIFGIGLPRSAGQTLAHALQILYPGFPVWHSIQGHKWDVLEPNHLGAVEVYAPYEWLERHWPNSLYICNWRDPESWLKSCNKVYQKSQDQRWNHPMWQYPPTSWLDYHNEYHERVQTNFPEHRILWWNIMEDPTWDSLCDFLDVEVPDHELPNTDRHGRQTYTIIDEESHWPWPGQDG